MQIAQGQLVGKLFNLTRAARFRLNILHSAPLSPLSDSDKYRP
jgi:hypothetical protein